MAKHAIIGRLLGSKVRSGAWSFWQRRHGAPATSPLLLESAALAIQAALEGLGTIICSPAFVREDLRAGRRVTLADTPLPTGNRYWLILLCGHIKPTL